MRRLSGLKRLIDLRRKKSMRQPADSVVFGISMVQLVYSVNIRLIGEGAMS